MGSIKAQAIVLVLKIQRWTTFILSALRIKKDESRDVVSNILQFFIYWYLLIIWPSATLSFVTPLVDRKFDVLPDALIKQFLVTTLEGNSCVARRVNRSFLVGFPNRFMWVDFVRTWDSSFWFHFGNGLVAFSFCFHSMKNKGDELQFC